MKALPPSELSPPWLGHLLQITDSAYPTGTFAHSAGLEGMVQTGQVSDLADLRHFLDRSVFQGLERAQLPLLRMSHEAALAGDGGRIGLLDEVAAATLTPEELRLASSRSGRQRLDLMARVMHLGERYPEEWMLLTSALRTNQLPVVAGIEAALLGIPVGAAMHAFAFGTLSGILSSSMKIMRLGQTPVQDLLRDLTGLLPHLVERSRGIDLDQIGTFSPVSDIASARHKFSAMRLFLS